MKYLFHIVGGQTAPNYIASSEMQADCHVLLYTTDSRREKELLKNVLPGNITELEISAFEFEKTEDIVNNYLTEILKDGDQAILNFTGGTKPAAIALFRLFDSLGLDRLYIDTQNNQLHIFKNSGEKIRSLESGFPVQILFGLQGQKVIKNSTLESQEQKRLRVLLEKDFRKFRKKILPDAFKYDSKKSEFKGMVSFYIDETSQIKLGESPEMQFTEDGRELLSYLFGKWFEVACFEKLKSTNYFSDLELNIRLEFGTDVKVQSPGFADKNEFDIVGVRNAFPYLFECKSGDVKVEHLEKLEILMKSFFPRYGTAILISYKKVTKARILERAKDKNIKLIHFEQLDRIDDLLNAKKAHLV